MSRDSVPFRDRINDSGRVVVNAAVDDLLRIRAAFDANYRKLREEQIATSYRPTTWRECAESLWQALHGRSSELSRECVLSFNQNNVVRRDPRKKAG